jgi:ERF superfamily
MHRSSESIANLAAALAKAQAELVNPEKTLTATIRSGGPKGEEQAFRYAPLSSGLEIVRKTLGQHQIATVQTTAIDQAAGVVNLTTVLAHASGEWIASDWPVCAIADTATPRRMGAALTYARRYALFTLVGIAGEDDVDAPDLATPQQQSPAVERPQGNGALNGGQLHAPYPAPGRSTAKVRLVPREPILDRDASAELRDRLLGEINVLASGDDAALWAHRSLPQKNRLIASDAQPLEQAFQARMTSFALPAEPLSSDQAGQPSKPDRSKPARSKRTRPQTTGIDKSTLLLGEPRRVRDREHVRYVAKQPCLICGRLPSDPHHLRFAQTRALGRKASDEFTVPLCRGHHREVHRCGDEAAWWRKTRLDPITAARALWLETHPMATGPGKLPVNVVEPAAAHPKDRVISKRDRRVSGGKSVRKSKPDQGTVPHGIA